MDIIININILFFYMIFILPNVIFFNKINPPINIHAIIYIK